MFQYLKKKVDINYLVFFYINYLFFLIFSLYLASCLLFLISFKVDLKYKQLNYYILSTKKLIIFT